MNRSVILLLIVTIVLLLMSLGLNLRQRSRLKPLANSCTHDITILTAIPIIDILSRTNEVWSGDQSISRARDAAWRIFTISVGERELYRDLGLVEDNDDERTMDLLIEKERGRMHNQALHGTAYRRP